ncbi:MAG: methylthioadenosine phosphorylase [Chloroflexi bacterium UTCFX4]|jgi:5'-methylthioadenosine phosphorylase|nr:MAG: methylthioadenosine phosphorylase [Chloroflexi bacterium UTCFX4]
MSDEIRFGVIGGSGVYNIEALTDVQEVQLDTPFGKPSDAYITGALDGIRVAFLARHGRGHRVTPTELHARANIHGFKQLGVKYLISITAVGSLRDDYAPLDIVIPDQLFDRTRNREQEYTFFGDGIVAHVSFADPFCLDLNALLYQTAQGLGATVHNGGTLVVIEGPMFSTKAESRINRQLGCDLVGMTAIPEAKLAREAEIGYAAIAMVTDYDAWHETHEVVTADMVVQNLLKNAEMGKKILRAALPIANAQLHDCVCLHALENAIVTNPTMIPPQTRVRLDLLVGKYLPAARDS